MFLLTCLLPAFTRPPTNNRQPSVATISSIGTIMTSAGGAGFWNRKLGKNLYASFQNAWVQVPTHATRVPRGLLNSGKPGSNTRRTKKERDWPKRIAQLVMALSQVHESNMILHAELIEALSHVHKASKRRARKAEKWFLGLKASTSLMARRVLMYPGPRGGAKRTRPHVPMTTAQVNLMQILTR